MTSPRYIVLDTETSALGPKAKAVERAWIEIDEDFNQIAQWSSLIDPGHPIDPGAMGVHHITNEMVADAPTDEEFFSLVHPGPIEGPTIAIAHNIAFDRTFWDPWMPGKVGEICTLRLARRYMPDVSNHKLQTLRYTYGLVGDAHRALGDVQTCVMLLKLLCDIAERPLAEMVAATAEPVPITKMPFGKHKGLPLEQVPRDYAQWLLRQDNVDPDLVASFNAIGMK